MEHKFGENMPSDDLKKKYLEAALNANKEAADGAKFTDLFDKDSTIYEKPEAKPAEVEKKPEPPKPTTDSEGYPIIDRVRTYKEDLQDIISKDKISLERIAMMQGEAKQKEPEQPKPEIKKANRFWIAGGALLTLGVIAVFGAFIFRKQAAAPVDTAPKERYIIYAETSNPLSIEKSTKTEIKSQIKGIADGFKEQDNVLEIVPAISAGEAALQRAPLGYFFTKSNVMVPDDMARTLGSRFFLGLYSKLGRTDPFMIIYTNSYDISYAALLKWEGILEREFDWLFDPVPKTSTSTQIFGFKDKVIANKDARSYEDETGRSGFFYLFLDQNTILFARTTDTVRMVEKRLREAKFQ